jgi:hypothetical protein
MKHKQYIGIILGAIYGIVMRLLMNPRERNSGWLYDIYDLYSVTFIWITPILIGIIPVLFAKKELLQSSFKQFFYPFLSVFLFFVCALTSGLEDWLCLLIITLPFLIGAGIAGILTAYLVKRNNSNKLLSILFLPLLLSPLESIIKKSQESFQVKSLIEINASSQAVWNHLIEVPEISADEYEEGFFNFIGVPRPIRSKLELINGKEYRMGYFSDDLILAETIEMLDSLKFVSFDIHLDKSKLRNTPTNMHILKSQLFKFTSISYHLTKNRKNKVELSLICNYELNSRMNPYANLWANQIIKDFEERLLQSLKRKIEKYANNSYD